MTKAGRTAASGIAVVIITRNRPALLQRCLGSLVTQSAPPAEVIVVDDASDSGTGEVAETFVGLLPIRLLRHPYRRGAGAARNTGWRAAASAYVAMTDDDCRAHADWILHLGGAADADKVVVGRTVRDPDDGPITSVFDRAMEAEGVTGRFSTCNILYPRALLARVGGFDEAYVRPYGEDTDVGQRARIAGAEETYVSDALVYHAVVRQTPSAALKDRWRRGEAARLARRYPYLRQEIWQGVFSVGEHRQLLLGLAGLSLSRLSPVFLMLSLPWLRGAHARAQLVAGARPQSRIRILSQIGGLLLLDSVELASCATGSIRNRTLLL